MAQGSGGPTMDEPFSSADQSLTDSILVKIHDGMKVFDRDGKEVGKADGVYMGEVNEQVNERGQGAATAGNATGSATDAMPARIPAPTNQSFTGAAIAPASRFDLGGLPDVEKSRLLRLGFIRIAGGLFRGTHFALPDQIANVEGNRVNLKVTRDELIKG